MKKAYSKPEIMFEDFSLSTNVAAGCTFKTDTKSEGDCGYPNSLGTGTIFTEAANGCKYHVPDNNDSLCYHVPNEHSDIFNS
jgi:hypothetical protein